jgi:hypothetical protein
MKKSLLLSVASIAMFSIPALSHAAMSTYVIDISGQSSTDSAPTTVPISFTWDPTVPGWSNYSLVTPSSPVAIGDAGTLKMLTVDVDNDPGVKLNFNVSSPNSTSTFTISSPVLSFAPIVNPTGFASSALTLTDNTGDNNGGTYTGGTLTGNLPTGSGGNAYEADYNGSTDFANLNGNFSATGTTVSDGGATRSPLSGNTTVAGTVSSISSQYGFTLSPLMSASGTSNFSLNPPNNIPEPTTAAIALVASTVGLMARRRKI